MKSLADRMTALLQAEKYRKENNAEYIKAYIDGALDMYNESRRYIDEACNEEASK